MDKAKELGLLPFGAVPSVRQIRHLREYGKKAFFHFGVNTFTNLEWGKGTEDASVFHPTDTDVKQWIKVVKEAGFTLAILTVKHHDGFCLWPSKFSEHNIANSPYQKDLLRQFTDACHELGVAVGLYLSPWDRNCPLWGTDGYNTYYNNQLTEILSNYGRVDEVWWDGAGSQEAVYDWALWAGTVRSLQPEAVIFGSLGATPYVEMHWVGNESGYAGDPHFATISNHALEVEDTKELNSGRFGGERFIPAEVDVSIRPGWFYHPDQDEMVKTPEQLAKIWLDSVGKGAIMLLNFPPDRRGRIPDVDADNALQAHRIITDTFAVNLAEGATVTADSLRHPKAAPEMILCDDYDSFYAAADDHITPTLTLRLPEAKTFDCFAIGEYVELGQRIDGYKVEAKVDGAWVLLAQKQSIGFKTVHHFAPVCSDTVRLTVLSAAAPPVLREFGLYKLSQDIFAAKREMADKMEKAVDLCTLSTAEILREDKELTVAFGGIFPFNTIRFDGNGVWRYEILAFDGTKYYSVFKGNKPACDQVVRLEHTVEGSYQLKFVTSRPLPPEFALQIYRL